MTDSITPDSCLNDAGLFLNPVEHKAYAHACRKLDSSVAWMALAATLAEARNVFGVLMVIQSAAEGGMGTVRPAGWPRVGQALIEMLASGRAFSALALQRFLEKIPEAAPQDGAALMAAREWVELIYSYQLDTYDDPEKAMEQFNAACAEGQFADAAAALRVLQAVNPTGVIYRAATTAEARLALIHDVLRRDPSLLAALPPAGD